MNIDKNINKKVESKIESSKIDELFFNIINIIPESKEKIENIKSQIYLLKEVNNIEFIIEKFKELKEYLIEERKKNILSNKNKKKIGKIIYKDLSFLENESTGLKIPKEAKILFLSLFFALSSINNMEPQESIPSVNTETIENNNSDEKNQLIDYKLYCRYEYEKLINEGYALFDEQYNENMGLVSRIFVKPSENGNIAYISIKYKDWIKIEEQSSKFKNGELISKYKYQYNENGNIIGQTNYCLENGKIKEEQSYENGKLRYQNYFDKNGKIGYQNYFDENGKIVKTEYYNENGKLQRQDYYNENGKLQRQDYYNENGKLQRQDYYDKIGGVKQKNCYYENGKVLPGFIYDENGILQQENFYDENGILQQENFYDENEKLVKTEYYNENGKLKYQNYFDKNGKLKYQNYFDKNGNIGCQNYFNENGKIVKTEYYNENGKLKRQDYYDEHGTVQQENFYNENEELQRQDYYDENKNLKQRNYYDENGRVLPGLIYDENGILQQENYYDENGKLGYKNYFDENGKIVKTEYYNENGILQQENFYEENYHKIFIKAKTHIDEETNTIIYDSPEQKIYCDSESRDLIRILKEEKSTIAIYNLSYFLDIYDTDEYLQNILQEEMYKNAVYYPAINKTTNELVSDLEIITKIFNNEEYKNIKILFSDFLDMHFDLYIDCINKDSSKQEKKNIYTLLNKSIDQINLKNYQYVQYYADQILNIFDEDNLSFNEIGQYLQNIPHFKNNNDIKVDFLKYFDQKAYNAYDTDSMLLGGLINLSNGEINLNPSEVELSKTLESANKLNSTEAYDVLRNIFYNYKNKSDSKTGVCSHIALFTSALAESIGFKSFVISNNTHLLSVIQDKDYISLITWGESSEPSFEKISLDDLIKKVYSFTGSISLYETFFSDLYGNIVLKKTGKNSGSLINEIVGQVPINDFVNKELTINSNLSSYLLEHTEHKTLNIDNNSKVVYFELSKESDILKEMSAIGYTRLFKLSDIQKSGFGSSFLLSTFLYDSKIQKEYTFMTQNEKHENIKNIAIDIKTKIEKTTFTKDNILEILNINSSLGFLGNAQSQLPLPNSNGFSSKPLDFSFGEFGKVETEVSPSSNFHIIVDANVLFKTSFIDKVSSIKPTSLYHNIITQGGVKIETNSLDMKFAFSSEIHKAGNFNEILFNLMIKNGILEGLGAEYKINIEKLTEYGEKLMPMIKDSVYTDEFSAKKAIGGNNIIITAKNLISPDKEKPMSFSIVLDMSI